MVSEAAPATPRKEIEKEAKEVAEGGTLAERLLKRKRERDDGT